MRRHFTLYTLVFTIIALGTAQAQSINTPWSESFESWVGQSDYYWLPEGWSRQVSNESLRDQYQTWFCNVQTSDYAPAPADGSVYAEILGGDTLTQQDEWLITPSFVPQTGDRLSYYAILTPFNLFDPSYYVYSEREFSERHIIWDLYTLIEVDGCEWQTLDTLSRYWIDVDGWTLRRSQGYGCEQKRVLLDLSTYAGHEVRIGFRYKGCGGDALFLDLVSVGTPTVLASYTAPLCTMYYGINPDYTEPQPTLYMPSGCDFSFTNTSSSECNGYNWQYVDAEGEHQSAEQHLTLHYDAVSGAVKGQTYELPSLTSSWDGILSEPFTLPNMQMQVGGKLDDDGATATAGSVLPQGVGNYNPMGGRIALTDEAGLPVFGVRNGQNTYWQGVFDAAGSTSYDHITLTALYNGFDLPLQPYALSSCWVQGVGSIPDDAELTLTVHRLTDAGAIDQEALGTAVISGSSVQRHGTDPATGLDQLTLMFEFDRTIYVDEVVYLRLTGLNHDELTFIPYQSLQPELECHGYVRIQYNIAGTEQQGISMWPISYGSTAQYGSCSNAFYFTLGMHYITRAEYEAGIAEQESEDKGDYVEPADAAANTMVINNELTKKLRSAFYDESDAERLDLWLCAGEMDYGDVIDNTFHIHLSLPRTLIGDTIDIDNHLDELTIQYYSIDPVIGILYTADHGKLFVHSLGGSNYYVWLKANDGETREPFSALYNRRDWKDYTVERPHPSYWQLVTTGERHELNSCVVDFNHADSALVYLSETPDVKTVDQMQALAPEPIVLLLPQDKLDGRILGYSALGIYGWIHGIDFQGVHYTSACTADEADNYILGANIMVDLDSTFVNDRTLTDNYIDIDFNIYNIASLGSSLKGHYDGTFCWEEGHDAAIRQIEAPGSNHGAPDSERPATYDLFGRIVTPTQTGIIVRDGDKLIIR